MQGKDASNPEFALHLAELSGEVKELGVLEFNLQTNWLRSMYRKVEEEGEEGGGGFDSLNIESGKHSSAQFGGGLLGNGGESGLQDE